MIENDTKYVEVMLKRVSDGMEEYLKDFEIRIDLALMRSSLSEQKSLEGGTYRRASEYVGGDYFKTELVNGIYRLQAILRSDPMFMGVQRQLFLSQPSIKIGEMSLPIKCSESLEATLTSQDHAVAIYHQKRDMPDRCEHEEGFFVPDSELTSNQYTFKLGPGSRIIYDPFKLPIFGGL